MHSALAVLIASVTTPENPELAEHPRQLHERQRLRARQQHLERARRELSADNYQGAVQAFTDGLELTVARSHAAARKLGVSERWGSMEAPRVELADMYSGRSKAHVRLGGWAEALDDAHAAIFLAPGSRHALSLLAASAKGLASLPQEPLAFFMEEPLPGKVDDDDEIHRIALNKTEKLCHALLADAFSMLVDGLERASLAEHVTPVEYNAAVASRDEHIAKAKGVLEHSRVESTRVESVMHPPQAFNMMTRAVESLAMEPLSTESSTPKVALLAQTLISVTAFRLGCRLPLLECGKHLHSHSGSFKKDRIAEAWLRSRAEARAAPTLRNGQPVRLAGLTTRDELNGELGEVVSYDQHKDRYGVKVASAAEGKRLLLKAANLVAEEAQGGQLNV